MEKRVRDESWDYQGVDTKEYTHGMHPYPAMMIPQVARRLFSEFGVKNGKVFDPFCGSGTTLVEASISAYDGLNMQAVGSDLNPLARLVSRVKTSVEPTKALACYLSNILEVFESSKDEGIRPHVTNMDYWFKESTADELARLLHSIRVSVDIQSILDFFLVPFSEVVRAVSLTRDGEFKLFRIAKDKIADFNPSVIDLFKKKAERNIAMMSVYSEKRSFANVSVLDLSAVESLHPVVSNVDLVVTSPPYGDSRTTVAYGQFCRLQSEWLGLQDAKSLDKRLMGGTPSKDFSEHKSKTAQRIINEIRRIDPRRALDVDAFFLDYALSIENIAKTLASTATVCYVVGNRTVKDVQIPLDEITAEHYQLHGLKHDKTIVRAIPSKRMPSKNSPSNKKGMKGTTMNYEYVVILRK